MNLAPPPHSASDALTCVLEAVEPAGGVELFAAFERMKGRLLDRAPRPIAMGRYQLIRELGRGALGVVFLARDDRLKRDVAIKILQRGPYAGDLRSHAGAALLQEARSLAAIDHPHIVTAFDCGVGSVTADSPAEVYLVMEYIRGTTLAEWLEDAHSVAEIRRVFRAAGEGLAAAHRVGIVHRDFKPQNVLLSADGAVKVTDFGLARLARDDTSIEGMVGTPAFMAPEQYSRSSASAQSDQFAFCLSLCAGLVGELPRRDANGNVVTDLARHREIPRRLRLAIERGLDPDPKQRHPSLDPILRALQERRPIRRRVWLLVPAAAAIGSLGWAGPAPECDTTVGAWSSDTQRDLQRAFESSTKSYAGAVWKTVESRVDAYAVALADRRQASCEATTAVERVAQRRCLDTRERELATSIRMWMRPEAVEHAVASAFALKSVESCAGAEASADLVEDNEARTLIEEARALAHVGESVAAAEVAQQAIDAADAAGDARASAKARLQRGDVLITADVLGEARRELESAFFLANLSRDDAVALDAAISLTHLVGFSGADSVGAQRWREDASERLADSPSDRGRVRLAYVLGAIAQRHSRFDEAVEHFRSVLEDESAGAESPVRRTNAHNGLGLSLANLGALEEGRAHLIAAIELCTSTMGEGHPRCATPMANLANVEQRAGRGREAIPIAQRALRIREQELGPEHSRVAEALTALGLIWFGLDEVDKASAAHHRALEIFEARLGSDHMATATARYNVGLIYQVTDRPTLALEAYGEALRVMRLRLGPDDRRIATVYGSMGTLQGDLGFLGQARRSLERALALQDERVTPPRSLASTQFNLAELLVTSDRARALELARAARANLVKGDAVASRIETVDRWLAENAAAPA